MRCSYDRFLSEGYISKEQFFEFGLKETIYVPLEKAKEEWKHLKERIHNNGSVFIRGFGRKSHATHLYIEFYKMLIENNNVKEDPSNNAKPTDLISSLTGYSKNGKKKSLPIQNYQVSHVFGRTKNVYAFTAPWNIVYVPKILDPLTGHESRGDIAAEYKSLFINQSLNRFADLISDYNEIITAPDFRKKVDEVSLLLSEKISNLKERKKFKESIVNEFSPIQK